MSLIIPETDGLQNHSGGDEIQIYLTYLTLFFSIRSILSFHSICSIRWLVGWDFANYRHSHTARLIGVSGKGVDAMGSQSLTPRNGWKIRASASGHFSLGGFDRYRISSSRSTTDISEGSTCFGGLHKSPKTNQQSKAMNFSLLGLSVTLLCYFLRLIMISRPLGIGCTGFLAFSRLSPMCSAICRPSHRPVLDELVGNPRPRNSRGPPIGCTMNACPLRQSSRGMLSFRIRPSN